ncbi:MAG: hypothetical protein QG671_4124 [Actinomycetota bacterium]|jgi:hypothetical protein|nr:hypothetical protein [Actinomycetota bacterium]MDQ5975085.1 hypothetical protein [Actinomycetota bacterium]
MSTQHSFAAGDAIAIIGPGTWLLIADGATEAMYDGIWRIVERDESTSAVLAAMLELPLRDLPDFVLAGVEGVDVRVLARGSGMASVGDAVITGAGVTTWVEQVVPGSHSVVLSVGAEARPAARFHGSTGVFPASWIRIGIERPGAAQQDSAPVAQALSEAESIAAAVDEFPGDVEAPPPAELPDLGSLTIIENDEDSTSRPLVAASRCGGGHLNSPTAGICRICGSAVVEGSVTQVPQPVLGTLQFSNGDVVHVDRPVIIGRAPSSSLRGTQIPILLAVPGEDISRAHVEVRPEGWTVVVVDLNSANGTTIQLSGEESSVLAPNQPVPLGEGTVVTLTDGVSFRFQPE